MAITKRNILRILQYVTLCLGCGIFIVGNIITGESRWAVMLLGGVMLLWISNLIFSVQRIKERYIFFVFQLVLFVFLLGRPVIRVFSEGDFAYFTEEANQFALWALFLTLLCMQLGAVLLSKWRERRGTGENQMSQDEPVLRQDGHKLLARIALAAYIITAIAMYTVALEKVIVMDDYLELYTTFRSSLPYAVQTLGAMCKYAVCFYLATLPNKRNATIVLITFVGSAVLDLIVGVRNPLILRALFAVLYYAFRDTLGEGKKWIGKLERYCLIIGIPLVIIAMGMFGTVRDGDGEMADDVKEYLSGNMLQGVADFFIGQGTSYDTLLMAYTVKDDLPNKDGKVYTFGSFHDYIVNGTVGQKVFHSRDLGVGNTEERAIYGWNSAHALSYAYDRDNYLAGHGRGTSYILDVYFDAGYPGVIIFSLLLGGVLIAMTYLVKRGCFLRACILIGWLELFFAPRAEALGWMTFIIYIQFWLVAGGIYLAAALYKKGRACLKKPE